MSMVHEVGDIIAVGAGFTVTVVAVDVTTTGVLALSVTCSSKLQTPEAVEPVVAKE